MTRPLLDYTPPVSAYGARPYTIEELDAHPDADRIWATLRAVRDADDLAADKLEDDYRVERDNGFDNGFDAGLEAGYMDGIAAGA